MTVSVPCSMPVGMTGRKRACTCSGRAFVAMSQSEAFLREIGWRKFGDKYLDGVKIAKMMGIELPNDEVPYVAEPKIDKTWASFVDDEE